MRSSQNGHVASWDAVLTTFSGAQNDAAHQGEGGCWLKRRRDRRFRLELEGAREGVLDWVHIRGGEGP